MPEIFRSSKNTPQNSKAATSKAVSRGSAQLLSAFMVRPDNVRFETQEEKEEILLFMRRHLVTNFGWVFITLVLIVLPAFVIPFLIQNQLVPKGMPVGYFLVLPLIWYLGVFGYALTNFLYWFYNVYIVTNTRVVDIDWVNLLLKQVSSTQLERIQDVTYKQGGIVDSFFDFGNVFIQTAGTEPNFEFEAVPSPEHVVRQIDEILEKKELVEDSGL